MLCDLWYAVHTWMRITVNKLLRRNYVLSKQLIILSKVKLVTSTLINKRPLFLILVYVRNIWSARIQRKHNSHIIRNNLPFYQIRIFNWRTRKTGGTENSLLFFVFNSFVFLIFSQQFKSFLIFCTVYVCLEIQQ